ncbi:unnamed protein product [Blepharisma stoltei]|uniref:Uncharacterized protein n=1 Tax=Blepharisma stoltei TaxID=1481888 RepID=A0AAU9K9L1_9CILI|nr:unnamed protein product [Blepharisma stoltei]
MEGELFISVEAISIKKPKYCSFNKMENFMKYLYLSNNNESLKIELKNNPNELFINIQSNSAHLIKDIFNYLLIL